MPPARPSSYRMLESALNPSPQVPHRQGACCPKCAAPRVHRSHRRGPAERALALLGAKIHRCHACNVRFARLASSTIYMDDAQRALRRLGLIALMLAGALLVLVFMSWMIGRQAAFSPSEGRLPPPSTLARSHHNRPAESITCTKSLARPR